MKIVHIIPGSGGSFYCGNCLRDSKFFDAIRAEGHDAIKIPMYLPLFSNDNNSIGEVPVFYGAISIYLKQLYPIFRHAPGWVDKLLNSKPMLRLAARMANSTRASGLEDMTVSMLMGEHGKQKEELDKMVHWLKEHFRADVIHISNALLLGLAHKLKEQLNVPVVCSLQDEHVWVEPMHAEFAARVWELMQEKARDIDMFISVSHYYTAYMKERLNLDEARVTTLHLGVDPADYTYRNAVGKPRNIGYMSRLCYDNGLDILIDAFILLKRKAANHDVRLLLTGGFTGDDKTFISEQKKKIEHAGLSGNVEFIDDFSEKNRHSFLNRVSVLSVPVRFGEAFGIYLTEAMAAGIPVVQPALGAFPEIIDQSGGGITYPENDAPSLAKALDEMLSDKEKLHTYSQNARKSIEETFNIHLLATKMTGIYETLVTRNSSHSSSL